MSTVTRESPDHPNEDRSFYHDGSAWRVDGGEVAYRIIGVLDGQLEAQ